MSNSFKKLTLTENKSLIQIINIEAFVFIFRWFKPQTHIHTCAPFTSSAKLTSLRLVAATTHTGIVVGISGTAFSIFIYKACVQLLCSLQRVTVLYFFISCLHKKEKGQANFSSLLGVAFRTWVFHLSQVESPGTHLTFSVAQTILLSSSHSSEFPWALVPARLSHSNVYVPS